jgi:ADP-ribose pyrophosphatase YjhB (NUDIX family)
VNDSRAYPPRPILAVSAAIFRDRQVLLVRRAHTPARGLFTLPGGVVEVGESLVEAVKREVVEETRLAIEPVTIAGYREIMARDAEGQVEHHFVIMAFAAHWCAGEPVLNEELDHYCWVDPGAVAGLATTEGLARLVATARDRLSGVSA